MQSRWLKSSALPAPAWQSTMRSNTTTKTKSRQDQPGKKTLAVLLQHGLRPCRRASCSSDNNRDLARLQNLSFSSIRRPKEAHNVVRSIGLLARDVMPTGHDGLHKLLIRLVIVYMICRSADECSSPVALSGGHITLTEYSKLVACLNPLAVSTTAWEVPLSFGRAIAGTYCHPLWKAGNPFRSDVYTDMLVTWWEKSHQGIPTHLLLATVMLSLAIRSKKIIKFMLDNDSWYLSGPEALQPLYDLVVQTGTCLENESTVHSRTCRLGMLIDTIAVNYWRNKSGEPIRRLAAAASLHEILKILAEIPHVNQQLERAHVADYLTYMDKNKQRVPGLREHIPPKICPLGHNVVAFLQLTNAARRSCSGRQPLKFLSPTAMRTEFLHTVRDIRKCAPREVVLRPWQSAQDKVMHLNVQTLHSMVIQPTLCEVIKVFQTWLHATAGTNDRVSSPMAYRLKRLDPAHCAKRPAAHIDSKK